MVRVALLSFWHVHAKDYSREALAHPGVELVSIWDEDSIRGAREAAERDVPFEPELDRILNDPGIDGVIVTTSTAAHDAIVSAAIDAGKAVFVEKVLGPTLRQAITLRNLARQRGVVLDVALYRTRIPEILTIQSIIASGRIGQLTSARVRIAHGGRVPFEGAPHGWLPPRFMEPDASFGGAMIDLGAHPLYLNRLLLGMPSEISASYGRVTGAAGDDNAVALLSYDNGAIGVAETGLVSKSSPVALEVHGFEGSAISDAGSGAVQVIEPGPGGTRVSSFVPFDPTPQPTPFDRWVDHIQQNEPQDIRLAIELSAMAEAANLSAKTGVRVRLDQLDGWKEMA